MEDSAKNQQKFTPTPLQIRWIRTASKPDIEPTITAISQAVGCDRSNWYKWNEDPEFVEWWNREWERVMCNGIWRLDRIGMRRAEEDFRYWEALQKKYGKIESKQSIDIEIRDILEKEHKSL